MKKEFKDIADKWDKNKSGGRDDKATRKLCDDYVAANPAEFEQLAEMSLDQLVQSVELFRAAGLEDEQWKVETYLLHRFEPQNIGGVAQPTIRIPGN